MIGKRTALGRVTQHQEIAVANELAALAIAGLATTMVMLLALIVSLNRPPVD